MKLVHAFINNGGVLSSTATIDVPGLGNVEIKNALSDETRARVEAEAILALQQRLGIVCNFKD